MTGILGQNFTQQLFAYVAEERFEHPNDPDDRLLLKLAVQNTLDEAGVTNEDVDIQDKGDHLKILFRHSLDYEHYMALSFEERDKPVQFLWELPEERRIARAAKRLKNWLNDAAAVSQESSLIDISVSPKTYDVMVNAQNLDVYFRAWSNLSHTHRRKIADATILSDVLAFD